VTDHADPLGVDLFPPGEECQGVLGVRHLVKAAHLRALAVTLAAAAEIETKRHVAHLLEHSRLDFGMGLVLRSDEAVQDNEGRQPLARLSRFRNMDDGGKLEPVRVEGDSFLH
jgi:hypothetical protein